MLTAAVVVALAVLLGRLAGGRLTRLAELPLRGSWLALAAVAVQLLGVVATLAGLPAGPVYAVALAGSGLCVLAFVAVNRAVPGSGLVAAGLLLNALVVAANAAMPVSLHAAARAGVPAADAVAGTRHEPAGDATRLRVLGDVVPVPLPLHPEVVSVGDLLVAAGLAQLVVAGMVGPARRARRDPDQPRETTRLSASTT